MSKELKQIKEEIAKAKLELQKMKLKKQAIINANIVVKATVGLPQYWCRHNWRLNSTENGIISKKEPKTRPLCKDHGGLIDIIENEKQIEIAMKTLKERLKNDEGYRLSWVANIAMAFKDAWNNKEVIHDISNTAARNFIDQLIAQ